MKNLSEKKTPVIANQNGKAEIMFYNYDEDDVKQFIKDLKEELCRKHLVCLTNVKCVNCEAIDRLAGSRLNGDADHEQDAKCVVSEWYLIIW